MLQSNKPISIPVTRPMLPSNGKKGKWSLLLNKQKLKIQSDGRTQIKETWGDSVRAFETAEEPFGFTITIHGKDEVFSTASAEDTLMVHCIKHNSHFVQFK